jgi:hypothetical protein
LTPRTLTPPPTNRRMWRRLVALTHPDRAEDEELFIWTRNVFEYVVGAAYAEAGPEDARSSSSVGSSVGERIDFTAAFDRFASFEDLTARASAMAASEAVGEPYAALLRLLGSCYPAGVDDVAGYRAQHVGASYKQLAYVAHLAGFSASERTRWYAICREIPLAQRHAGHLIKELQARRAKPGAGAA